jgi:hypothetical protein
MTERPKTIISSVSVVASKYLWIMSLLIFLPACNLPQVWLSRSERQLIEQWSKECKCKVGYLHNYELIHDNAEIDTPVMYIEFSHRRDYKDYYYSRENDWCLEDSVELTTKAIKVSQAFLRVSPHAHRYKKITVGFSTLRNVGKKILLENFICGKIVVYDIATGQTTYEVRTWYPDYPY